MAINFCKKVGLTPDRPARTGVVTAENRHPKALDLYLLDQMPGRYAPTIDGFGGGVL